MTDNPTQNQNLPRPTDGSYEGTWGTEVMNNDMTDKLEKKLVARDLESNLGDYQPYSNAIFIAEDTGAVYDGDGSSWSKAEREFESLRTEQEDITSRVVRLRTPSGETYKDLKVSNYADYGALLNHIVSNYGFKKRAELPGGKQLTIGEKVAWEGDSTLEGQGVDSTSLQLASGVNDDGLIYDTNNENFPTIRDFKFNGNKGNNTGSSGFVMAETNATPKDLHMSDVFFTNFAEHGMHFFGGWGLRCSNSLTEFCDKDGLRVEGGPAQLHIDKHYSAHNGQWGYRFVDGGSGSFIDNSYLNLIAGTNPLGGAYLGNLQSNTVNIAAFNSNGDSTDPGVQLDGGSRNIINIVAKNNGIGFKESGGAFNLISYVGKGNTTNLDRQSDSLNVINGVALNNGSPKNGSGVWGNAFGAADFAFEHGVRVYDAGTDSFWVADNTGTWTLLTPLRGSATLDFTSIAAGATAEKTITVGGVDPGDPVFVGAPSGIESGLTWNGYCSANGTVTVRVHNTTSGSIDPASGTWTARVYQ